MMKQKFIFDLDGTITAEETLPRISNYFKIKEEIEQLTMETVKGNIPFVESFIKRVHLLKDLPVTEVSNLLENAKLNTKVIKFIEDNTANCIIATGNLDCWIEKLCKKIGCEYYCSNAIVENEKVIKLKKILKKEEIVLKYKKEGCRVVYIGDGNNDLEAMREADISIANGIIHQPAANLLVVTDYLIYTEEALCRQLNQLL